MDQMDVSVGNDGGDQIQLVAESELARFDKASNQLYTNAGQQDRHSGDLFYNFLHKIEGQKITWGARTPGNDSVTEEDFLEEYH